MILFGSFPFSSINILKCGNSVSRFDNIFLGQGRGVWSVTKNQLFSLRDTAMQLRSQRPLHARRWTKKNNLKKMEGQGGGEAQGVADPQKKYFLGGPTKHNKHP
jgi:hypothetical protein